MQVYELDSLLEEWSKQKAEKHIFKSCGKAPIGNSNFNYFNACPH